MKVFEFFVVWWLYLSSSHVCAEYFEYFELDANTSSGFVSDTQEFGCSGSKCNVTGSWHITGVCDELLLSVDLIGTAMDGPPSSSVRVLVNDGFIASCGDGANQCTQDYFECDSINRLDITNETFFGSSMSSMSSTSLSVTLVATQYVGSGFCGFTPGMDQYYDIYGRVSLFCFASQNATWYPTAMPVDPVETEEPSSQPSMSPTDPTPVEIIANDEEEDSVVLDTQTLSCYHYGDRDTCYDRVWWQIDGSCDEILLSISVFENDFNDEEDYVNVSINGELIGQCEGLDSACTWEWKTCTNIVDYDIASLVEGTDILDNGKTDILLEMFVSNEITNDCGAYIEGKEQYLHAQATLACVNGNASYTPAPVGAGVYDYTLFAVDNAVTSFTEEFGCQLPQSDDDNDSDDQHCSVVSSFNLHGYCDKVTLSLSVVETDFSDDDTDRQEYIWAYIFNDDALYDGDYYLSSFENPEFAYIRDLTGTYQNEFDVEGEVGFLGFCDDLNEDCTLDWVQCSDIYNVDISEFFDLTSNENNFYLAVGTSPHVNYCPYEKDGESFNLYASATITCFPPNATRTPTEMPTQPSPPPTSQEMASTDLTELVETMETTESENQEADGAFQPNLFVVCVVAIFSIECLYGF